MKKGKEEEKEDEKTGRPFIRGRGARALVVALAPREDNTQTDPGRHTNCITGRGSCEGDI